MFFSAVCMKTHKCATDVEQKLDSEKYYMLTISVLTIIRKRKTSLTKRNNGMPSEQDSKGAADMRQ